MEDLELCSFELVFKVGSHFFHFQLETVTDDFLVNIHDSDGNFGG